MSILVIVCVCYSVCVCGERESNHDILTGVICGYARDALDFGQLLFDHTFAVSACQRMTTQQQSVASATEA